MLYLVKLLNFIPQKKQIIEVDTSSYAPCILENYIMGTKRVYQYSNNGVVLVDTINIYCNKNQ